VRAGQPGDQLPSTRHIVEARHVSPTTVSRALALLAREGLIETRPGSGTFVAQARRRTTAIDHSWQTIALADRSIEIDGLSQLAEPSDRPGFISFATGYLHPSLMPVRALSGALARAARLPDAWDRPPAGGLHGLQSWFARSASPSVDASDVVITPGGQAAISAAFRALVPAGAPLLVESPTYQGALAIARAAGIRPVPVPVDEKGVNPELLAEAFSRTGAQAFYTQPTYQNPTGAVLDGARRAAVLEAAAQAGAFIIEDDYARWLSHGSRPERPLLADDVDGRVVYLTSLTKVASPSLRIGALIARGPVAQRLRAMRIVDDMFVPRPTQEAALELVSASAWTSHLRNLGIALGQRCRFLVHAINSVLPAASVPLVPQGGASLWVELPMSLDDTAVSAAARDAGVLVLPSRPFFAAEPSGPHLRMSYSSVANEGELETGVRRLAAAVPALAGD
jgi:DNA-binding transcriptional MocR family regulator